MNFARLNHILIPQRAEQRIAWKNSRRGRVFRAGLLLYEMLTPLGRFLLAFWFLITPVSMSLHITTYYIIWSIVTGALTASFLCRPLYRMRNVNIRVSVPKRIQTGETIQFSIYMENTGKRDYQAIEVEGPFLTWDGAWVDSRATVSQLPNGEKVIVKSEAKFSARGRRSLMPFCAKCLVPFGLASGAGVESNLVHFTVVPRFPSVSGLRIPMTAQYQPGGVVMASRTGEALEIVGVRPYQPGDRLRDLHSATWARTGVPHVREYHQEYFARVAVVLDTDLRKGKISERRFEASISLCAGVIASLLSSESLVDLIIAGSSDTSQILGRNMGQLSSALDTLAAVVPGPEMNLQALEDRLLPLLPQLSCMIVIAQTDDERGSTLTRLIAERGCLVEAFYVSGLPVNNGKMRWVGLSTVESSEEIAL